MHLSSVKMYHDQCWSYWLSVLKKHILNTVSRCLICQSVKTKHQQVGGLLQSLPPPEWKWECITCDFVIHLLSFRCQMDVAWVIVDRLTKSMHFILFVWPILYCHWHGCTETSLLVSMEFLRSLYRIGIPNSPLHSRDLFREIWVNIPGLAQPIIWIRSWITCSNCVWSTSVDFGRNTYLWWNLRTTTVSRLVLGWNLLRNCMVGRADCRPVG